MKIIKRKENPALFREWAARGVDPVLAVIFSNRGLEKPVGGLSEMLPPKTLGNIELAAKFLGECILRKRKILLISDYDADGATGCAIGVKGLRMLGADIDYLVPDRAVHGYGLTVSIVEEAKELKPDVILTVDNGVSSLDGVERARELGIDVVVTDHHLPGKELPSANVIVNPNLVGDEFLSKNLAGCGVMLYTVIQVRRFLMDSGFLTENIQLNDLFELAAIGSIADVVKLDYNNQVIVNAGMKRIRSEACSVGIRELIAVNNKSQSALTTTDVGFSIAPCINAAGRLAHMKTGIDLMLTSDEKRAKILAEELFNTNKERKAIQAGMLDAVDSTESDSNHLESGKCIISSDAGNHQGVIGIVAGRLKEKYHKPTFVFAPDDSGYFKGSARSVVGFNIRDALYEFSVLNPNLIAKFGGHAMAAGLSVEKDKFNEFKTKLSLFLNEKIPDEVLVKQIEYDMEVGLSALSADLALKLEKLIWGQGFPAPMFKSTVTVKNLKILKDVHFSAQFRDIASGATLRGVQFNCEKFPKENSNIDIYYSVGINRFNNRADIQLMISYFEEA